MNEGIRAATLIPKSVRWTTGKTVTETESGVPPNRWVWKVVEELEDKNGLPVFKQYESIWLSPKPLHYGSEEAANKGAVKFISETLGPIRLSGINKVIQKNWGLR